LGNGCGFTKYAKKRKDRDKKKEEKANPLVWIKPSLMRRVNSGGCGGLGI
jgi:hypothetical protein